MKVHAIQVSGTANGGVLVKVRMQKHTEIERYAQIAITMKQQLEVDPMLARSEPEEEEQDISGDYYFNWYTKEGIKRNPLLQATEFITYLVEEYGFITNLEGGILL